MSKELLAHIRARNLDRYGSVIPLAEIHTVLGIEYPTVAPRYVYTKLDLQVVDATSYVRNALLDEGKYLKADGEVFRILLPSENVAQVERYYESARRDMKRGDRLHKATPIQPAETQKGSSIAARMAVIKESLKSSRLFGAAS